MGETEVTGEVKGEGDFFGSCVTLCICHSVINKMVQPSLSLCPTTIFILIFLPFEASF